MGQHGVRVWVGKVKPLAVLNTPGHLFVSMSLSFQHLN